MTKIRKNSIRELLETDSGITFLVRQLVSDTKNNFTNDEMFGVYRVLLFQTEIQKEIISRLPFQTLEKIPENGGEGGKNENSK